jgi:hypothetical protein
VTESAAAIVALVAGGGGCESVTVTDEGKLQVRREPVAVGIKFLEVFFASMYLILSSVILLI